MFFLQPVPVQTFIHPISFSGIYSEDDYLNHTAQRRAAHDYALAHAQARVQAIERQRNPYRHPHYHRHHPGGHHRGPFAPASLDNFCYGFGPACASPAFSSTNRRGPVDSFEELAYSVCQEEERQNALEAISRQQEIAREHSQRQRALAEAAAREQQARAAHAARIHARQTRDEEVLLALLGQQQATAPVTAPSLNPVGHKGKGRAVDVPVEILAPISKPIPVPAKIPTLKEELEARMRSEADPQVQESLVLLYSDLFDAREPSQPVAGPSGHKHVSFEIPIFGPSSSASNSPVPVESVDTTATPIGAAKPEADETKIKEHDGPRLHRTPALPPAVAAKLLKFYRVRHARKPSLAQIKDVEDALRKLEGAFEFPAHLDFLDRSSSPSPADSESDTESALAYTANNTPVHVYENALNDLLTRLDAVESHGDLEVRGRRKEVVKEVERALEAMERRIEESRERSQEGTRRWSVSSQMSDASATVTPYNVHSSANVEVAVAAEAATIKVKEEAVEVAVEVEGTETTSEVEGVSPVAQDAPLEVKVPVPSEEAPTSLSTDNAEPVSPRLTVGIPHSGADTYAPSPSDESVHGDPISPVDDVEDLDRAFDVLTPPGDASAPQAISSTLGEAEVRSPDYDADVTEQDVGVVNSDAHFAAVAADATIPTPESEAAASESPSPAEDHEVLTTPFSTPLAPIAPEAISRVESSTTDATFVTAEVDSVPLSAAADEATLKFFTATPSEAERAQPLTPASTSSACEETFLLSSTPLADHQPKQRWPSTRTSAGDDELEIISKDELEAAKNDSDWSDVESDLQAA
ncbi:hypothetical protein LXA43DRAFT_1084922 [Ganoderma leucocontextum]|nr:hypothetical protein LXA43DRAFT_1084922 [Ganoderma leucocontextum]